MPLFRVGATPFVMDRFPFGLAFSMTTETGAPVCIWVIAEYIDEFSPGRQKDTYGRMQTVLANRAFLEEVANAKFERNGVNGADGEHEGMPILMLRHEDMTIFDPRSRKEPVGSRSEDQNP